ncbi:hypothetical protein I79_025175 [Cricetulus griseus]|uniref:Uncharacterized protein n=1 Tax=Cricetulus griseus TaxID=10029 RepID=G3IMN4_CRIGR|nr:hypothetical protein I79_025175 [Cricetulus griseus]
MSKNHGGPWRASWRAEVTLTTVFSGQLCLTVWLCKLETACKCQFRSHELLESVHLVVETLSC